MRHVLGFGVGLAALGFFVGCGGGESTSTSGNSTTSTSSGVAGGGGDGTGGNGGSAGGAGGAGGMGTSSSSSSSSSGSTSSSSSSSSGSMASCGNSVVDYLAGEQCDDGNATSGDGCSSTCQIEAVASCGNGMLDLATGEECDDGNKTAGDGCSPACQLEIVGQACGNGMKTAPEVCDDSNTTSGDGCNATCNSTETSSIFVGMVGSMGTTDGIGTAARISGAGSLAADVTGLWLGDSQSRTLRRIDIATKAVTTVAGTAGMGGYVDNPTGTAARFGSLEAITTDGTTIWVADGPNHVIRAVTNVAPYSVTTAVGSGVAGMIQDGVGAAAQLDDTRGLTYYKGKVYFVDANAAVVRSFDPATKDVKTIAGTAYQKGATDGIGAAARFQSPRYIASDGSGMLYISDTNGNTIRAFNTVTNQVTTFAGNATCGHVDGMGTSARINRPRGITSDGTSVFWVEFDANTIRQGVVATQDVGTFSGTPAACSVNCSCGGMPPGGYVEGIGAAAVWNRPFEIEFHWPTNSFFVIDSANFVIRRIQ